MTKTSIETSTLKTSELKSLFQNSDLTEDTVTTLACLETSDQSTTLTEFKSESNEASTSQNSYHPLPLQKFQRTCCIKTLRTGWRWILMTQRKRRSLMSLKDRLLRNQTWHLLDVSLQDWRKWIRFICVKVCETGGIKSSTEKLWGFSWMEYRRNEKRRSESWGRLVYRK